MGGGGVVPRAIWSGAIAFGLVNVPVRMESAVEEHALHFNYLHEPDGGRIGYQKVCKAEDRPVPDDEVVKAFEVSKGKFVPMTEEDFEAAELAETRKTIDIHAFVDPDEIDPVFFERTYYLGPRDGAEKVYTLLARAMSDSNLVAVATFVMRDREHLACLRVRDGVLTLERMHFADEIRSAEGLAPKGVRIGKDELRMASRLVEQFAGAFRPDEFQDTYRKALRKVIRAKERGETLTRAEAPDDERPVDLMAALRESVEDAKRRRGGGRRPGRARSKAA
jgi:DNA end-binding protein Ku